MKYFYYDTVVFRQPRAGALHERWLDGTWKPATGNLGLSEEEFLRLREVSEEEANRLRS